MSQPLAYVSSGIKVPSRPISKPLIPPGNLSSFFWAHILSTMPKDANEHLGPAFVPWVKQSLRQGIASSAKSSTTIDKIPSNWRDVRNDAFNPEMIRIGPLRTNDGRDNRQWFTEEHKARFLNRLLEGELEQWRSDGDMSGTAEEERLSVDCERGEDDGGRVAKALCLDDLAEAMRTLEHKTKAFYSKNINTIPDVNFVMMMVVDGCFVVELLRLCFGNPRTKAIEDDPILTNPHILTTLRRDLLLLENQLPFFVLEKLYELISKKKNPDHQQAVPLEELAVTFFNPLLPRQNVISKLDAKKRKHHLLDIFRSTFLKSAREKVDNKGKNRVKSRSNLDGSMRGPYFASELNEAGVKFKEWRGHDLLDIEFGRRTLWVPPLSLNDNTISLLLNFVAYELSVNHPESFFTNYLMFWGCLVNSPRDIQILHKHRIISNMGSEKAVAELLMRCREVISNPDLGYFYDKIEKVNHCCQQYYESKFDFWWRSLIRERFSSPWTCLSLFAAIILLLLTILQTFYTMYAYYRQH
ncbi:hypothetical protein ACJRO7_031563 [Eucalyptus globulus]|uniref:Uncharacterized protein n=1 Tax=Eucalyptus globulus TaxID=34317 RepID=A0ABD3JT47_EUCGL